MVSSDQRGHGRAIIPTGPKEKKNTVDVHSQRERCALIDEGKPNGTETAWVLLA
jgi:hypothetical protein